jgi:hypothetical protein
MFRMHMYVAIHPYISSKVITVQVRKVATLRGRERLLLSRASGNFRVMV